MTDAPVGAVDVSAPEGAEAEGTTVKHPVAIPDSTERDARGARAEGKRTFVRQHCPLPRL